MPGLCRAAVAAALPALSGCHVLARLDELAAGGHPPPDVAWARSFGDLSDQRITALAVDGDGSIVVAGSFRRSIDFGAGPLVAATDDLFVAKLAPDGSQLWSRRFGANVEPHVESIAVGERGDIVLAGDFKGTLDLGAEVLVSEDAADAFVAKLDVAGTPVWARRLGGQLNQTVWSVAIDDDENVIAAGSYDRDLVVRAPAGGALSTLPGEERMFLVKFRREGGFLDAFGYGNGPKARASAVAAAHDIFFAGTLYGTADVGVGALAAKGSSSDIFVARVNGGGGHVWSDTFGDADPQCYEWCELGMALDANGRVLLTGAFNGSLQIGATKLTAHLGADVFLAAFDGGGAAGKPVAVWATSFGDQAPQRPYGLAVLGRDEPVVGGGFRGTITLGDASYTNADGANDVFVAGYRADGTVAWSRAWAITSAAPDSNTPASPRVAAGPDRSVVVAGSFRGTLRAGDALLGAVGGDADSDAFVVKLAPR
jgi:hypothetical protein